MLRSRTIGPSFAQQPTTLMRLKCGACGHTARYSVGTVCIHPGIKNCSTFSKSLEKYVSFGGYFRCKKCGSAWPWELTSDAMMAITALMASKVAGIDDDRLVFAISVLFDGSPCHSVAQAEDYLTELLERDSENALVWNRLGNIYIKSNLLPRARKAFERALELNPNDMESHFSLGAVLKENGKLDASAEHFHTALRLLREDRKLPEELKRDFVRNALEMTFDIHFISGGRIQPMPMFAPSAPRNPDEPVVVHLQDFNIDLSDERDWDRLIDVVLGKPIDLDTPRKRLPSPVPVVARKAPCPCGSGRKYKRCCGA